MNTTHSLRRLLVAAALTVVALAATTTQVQAASFTPAGNITGSGTVQFSYAGQTATCPVQLAAWPQLLRAIGNCSNGSYTHINLLGGPVWNGGAPYVAFANGGGNVGPWGNIIEVVTRADVINGNASTPTQVVFAPNTKIGRTYNPAYGLHDIKISGTINITTVGGGLVTMIP